MKIVRRTEIPEEDRGGYVIQRLLTKEFGMRPENVGFYYTIIPCGSKCKEQWHKLSYEAVFFLTPGSAKLGGKEYDFDAGDLVVLDPDEKHEWLAPHREVRLFAMRFPNLLQDKYTETDSHVA